MRLLLDTHAFIWAVEAPARLPRAVRSAIEDRGNTVTLSVVTVWETGMKAKLGRLGLTRPIDTLVTDAISELGFEVLPVALRHALRLTSLEPIHGDPFDRMLVAQAIEERMTLVTRDPALHAYPVDHLW